MAKMFWKNFGNLKRSAALILPRDNFRHTEIANGKNILNKILKILK